jgi:DNA-binding transcriptional LysR family regulator
MSLRFRQLQALHAVIETGTVTSAASLLGISQPGISNLLAQLERQTRIKLFDRVKGRLAPTPEATVLFREIDTVVRGLDHVSQAVTDLQNKQAGQLQVASQHSMSFGFMPNVIARFAKDRSDISISFQSQYSQKIQEWVMAGLFEIGVCEKPIHSRALNHYDFQVEMCIAMPQDSPLAVHEVLTPALLEDVPFIVMGPDHMTHRRTREAFETAGIPLKPRVYTHLFKNMLSFVKEGMGVSLLDRFAVEFDFEGGFITRPFRPAIEMDMMVVTSDARPLSVVGQEFLELLLRELEPYSLTPLLPAVSDE